MSRPARKKNPKSSPPPSATPHWLLRTVTIATPSLLFLFVGLRFFVSTGRDDAHITYWPAYTLANFGQILNHNGERVEQSSSLLHVLLLALANKITTIDIVTLGRLSSIAGGVGTLLLVYLLVRQVADRTVAFAGAMLAATSAYFMYWSFGGLETTLVSFTGIALVITCANYLTRPNARIAMPLLAATAFATVRPESPLLLLGITSVATLLALSGWAEDGERRIARKRAVMLLGFSVAIFLALVAFRKAYFGSAFPQPVVAKYAGLTASSLLGGIQYLRASVFDAGPGISLVMGAAGLACLRLTYLELRARPCNPYLVLSLAFVAIYLAFAVASGGDWMESARFFVFFLPLALALIPVALARSFAGERSRLLAVSIGSTLLAILGTASLLSFARAESPGTLHWQHLDIAQQHDVSHYSWFEKRNRVNLRDVPIIEFIGTLIPDIEAVRPGPVVMMTGQMGMIPYHVSSNFLGRIRYIDRRGLCDRMLTDCDYSHSLIRDSRGLHMDYLEFFEDQQKIEAECGLPRPDVVFDLRGGNTQIVAENGYRIVARQYGEVKDAMAEGREVEATGFVAVRTPLWAAIVAADSIRSLQTP